MKDDHQRQGNAILFVLLISTVLATVALGVGNLSLSEVKMQSGLEDAAAAYYAAEAGLEQGLMRWRYDHNVETQGDSVGAPATAETQKVLRVDITANQSNQAWQGYQTSSQVAIENPLHSYYDLKIWYKSLQVGDWANVEKSERILKQDEVAELAGFTASFNLKLKYAISDSTKPDRYVEVKVVHLVGPAEVKVYGPTQEMTAKKEGLQLAVAAGDIVRIKPWNTGIRYALADAAGAQLLDNGETVIEAVGHFGGVKRKLQAKIDRKSGQLLGVDDFTLYSGKGNIKE